MKPPKRLETKRLVLREPRMTDALGMYESYAHDPEVTRYVMWHPHTSVKQTKEFLRGCLTGWKDEKRFPYIITLKSMDNPIGMVDFHIRGSTVGIGYVIGRAYWGKGLVPEAVLTVMDWALNQPSIFRVNASCDVENAASIRVLEKVGMQREGLMRRYVIHPNISNEPRDCYLYAIVRL